MPFFHVDPRGTYLARSPADNLLIAATRVNLLTLGVSAGDALSISSQGDFKWAINGANDEATSLIGVFVDAQGKFLAGIGGNPAFSIPQNETGIATDIPQDFSLGNTASVITVPVGAVAILFSPNDSYFSDNSDPDGDFGANITRFGPDTGLLKFDIATAQWQLDGNSVYRYSGTFTVNGMRVVGHASIAPDGAAVISGVAAMSSGGRLLFNAGLQLDAHTAKGDVTLLAANYLYFGGLKYTPQRIDLSQGDVRLVGGNLQLPTDSFGGIALNYPGQTLAIAISNAANAAPAGSTVNFGALDLFGEQHVYFASGLDASLKGLALDYDSAKDNLKLSGKLAFSTPVGGAKVQELSIEVTKAEPLIIHDGVLSAGTARFGIKEFSLPGFKFSFAGMTRNPAFAVSLSGAGSKACS